MCTCTHPHDDVRRAPTWAQYKYMPLNIVATVPALGRCQHHHPPSPNMPDRQRALHVRCICNNYTIRRFAIHDDNLINRRGRGLVLTTCYAGPKAQYDLRRASILLASNLLRSAACDACKDTLGPASSASSLLLRHVGLVRKHLLGVDRTALGCILRVVGDGAGFLCDVRRHFFHIVCVFGYLAVARLVCTVQWRPDCRPRTTTVTGQ